MLLLSYFFPPTAGGGVVRPVKMAKQLERRGWKVTVITVAADGVVDPLLEVGPSRILRVDEWPVGSALGALDRAVKVARSSWASLFEPDGKGLALSLGFIEDEVEIAASHVGWAAPAVRTALRLYREHPFDLVIASTPPASAGTTAWILNRLRKVPYLVEYRDPWTVSPIWEEDELGAVRRDPVTRGRTAIARRLESILLRGSSGAIVVNGSTEVAHLRTQFSRSLDDKPVVQIRNGVDVDDLQRGRDAIVKGSRRRAFRILHAGFFYYARSPHQVLEAVREIRRHDAGAITGVEFEFLGGGFPPSLAAAVARWGLGDVVKVTAPKSYSDVLVEIHEADALLVVLPRLRSHTDCIPTKLYEYLATGLPIVAVVDPEGAVAAILRDLSRGFVVDNTDVSSVCDGLAAALPILQRRSHSERQGDPFGEEHDYAVRAEELDALLRNVVQGS